MSWYLDAFFDRRQGGVEVIGGVFKWVVPCNWKFPAENFGGDSYHVGWSHTSALRTGTTSTSRSDQLQGAIISPMDGHSIISRGAGEYTEAVIPGLMEYEEFGAWVSDYAMSENNHRASIAAGPRKWQAGAQSTQV